MLPSCLACFCRRRRLPENVCVPQECLRNCVETYALIATPGNQRVLNAECLSPNKTWRNEQPGASALRDSRTYCSFTAFSQLAPGLKTASQTGPGEQQLPVSRFLPRAHSQPPIWTALGPPQCAEPQLSYFSSCASGLS